MMMMIFMIYMYYILTIPSTSQLFLILIFVHLSSTYACLYLFNHYAYVYLCLHRDAYKKVINQFIGISNIRLNELLNLQETMEVESDEILKDLSIETINDKIKFDTNWVFINSRLLAMRFMKDMMILTRNYTDN